MVVREQQIEWDWNGGEFHDEVLMDLLAEEFLERYPESKGLLES